MADMILAEGLFAEALIEMDIVEGTVERITFLNEENAYTVAKLLVEGELQPTTIVGQIPGITEGELLKCTGIWVDDARYGRQFKVQ